jgi:hypothetical protein
MSDNITPHEKLKSIFKLRPSSEIEKIPHNIAETIADRLFMQIDQEEHDRKQNREKLAFLSAICMQSVSAYCLPIHRVRESVSVAYSIMEETELYFKEKP